MKSRLLMGLFFFLLIGVGLWVMPRPGMQPKVEAKVDLAHLGGFDEVLFPVGETPSEPENQALALALTQYRDGDRHSLARYRGLEEFLTTHPNSPWKPSLRFNLGMSYYSVGRYTLSLKSLRESWNLLKDSKEPDAKATADLALAQLCGKLSTLGRYEELEPLLKQSKGRSLTGSATSWMTQAWENFVSFRSDPSQAFTCGPVAVSRLCDARGALTPAARKVLEKCLSSSRGTSLKQLADVTRAVGLQYQMAYRQPGAPLLTPALMHFQVGHYATLLEQKDQLYAVQDLNAVHQKMHPEVLDLEASGYFLVPAGALPTGWRSVSAAEGARVWGRGVPTADKNDAAVTPHDQPAFPDDDDCQKKKPKPLTTWNAHAMIVSLSLQDTPVGLSPAAFSVPFRVDYSQRDPEQPAVFDYPNLGPKWHSNWISFVTDHRFDGFIEGVQLHYGGGGVETFSQIRVPVLSPLLKPGVLSQSQMASTSTGFVRDLPDGTHEVYDKRIGNRYFLTSRRDPQGNTVVLNWDGSRLVSIQDPVGRLLTISYEQADDPLKITKVTDFAGRSATFTYASGHLTSVTDILGITSSYQWGANDFIQSLTTPYGTTQFGYVDNSLDTTVGFQRVLTVTDPAGRNYRVECRGAAPGVAFEDPNPPSGMTIINAFLNYRNSYVWTPAQLAGGLNYNNATQIHFTHTVEAWREGTVPKSGGTGRVVESIKAPLERRVWFFYPTEVGFPYYPSSNQPSHIGKVLADGSTQLTRLTYNAQGNPTQKIDPAGRVYDYTYDANGIDVTAVTVNGQPLASATYDGQHNPIQVTDSAGATTSYTYNGRGQVLTATNPLGETTTYAYTGDGNLSSVQSPLSAVTSFSHDAAGRVVSATDSEGYTVQADYDNADRPTQVTFPDGSTETLTYNLLDLVSTKDRNGRTTHYQFDPVQRLEQITDGNGGVTTLGYSEHDSPVSLVDPGGRATVFGYDLNSRPTLKQYGDGGTQVTTYWPCCLQVRSITDALGHSKNYTYNVDNTLKDVTYSGTTPPVSFAYDTLLPRPVSMTDGRGQTNYTYVPFGSPGANALASLTTPTDTATFNYDVAGRMTGRTVNGQSETQTFDPLWRTTSTTNALDTFNLAYLGTTGQVTGINSTLGPNMQYAYGTNLQDRRLLQIRNLDRVSGALHSQFDYTYDPVGQITRLVETYGGGSGTPTPTPTNTTTPTPTPTGTPPCDDDDHHHGGHHGNGHGHGHPGNHGNGHNNGGHGNGHGNNNHGGGGNHNGNHGNGHNNGGGNGNNNHGGNRGRHSSVFSGPLMGLPGGPGGPGAGSQALPFMLFTLCAGLMAYTASRPGFRRQLPIRVASAGMMGLLALNGCLVGNVNVGAGTTNTYDFSYDQLGQLIGVNLNNTPAASFQFDPSGNLVSLTTGNTTEAFTYNNLNQPTSPGTNVFDAKGQTTDQNGRQFEWDDDGRCTAIVMGTHRSEFTYDGFGRRVRIVEKEGAVVESDRSYFWVGYRIVSERDGLQSGLPVTKRYFSQGVVANGVKLFYTFDHLGSVRSLVDDTGAVRADYRYTTYGERTKESGDLDSDWGFAGLWHHEPSGLDLATYRVYDSAKGRWISRDPLGEGNDFTLYSYCSNDPINCTDEEGLQPILLGNGFRLGGWRLLTRFRFGPGGAGRSIEPTEIVRPPSSRFPLPKPAEKPPMEVYPGEGERPVRCPKPKSERVKERGRNSNRDHNDQARGLREAGERGRKTDRDGKPQGPVIDTPEGGRSDQNQNYRNHPRNFDPRTGQPYVDPIVIGDPNYT